MFRIARLLVPLTSVAAAAVLLMILTPALADGRPDRSLTHLTGDVYAFGHDAEVNEPVAGNAQVYGGSAMVNAPIEGDLLVIGGNVTFGPNGRVAGNVIHAGGTVVGAEGRVNGRVHPLASLEGAAASLNKSAVVASLLFVWLAVAVALALFAGREVRSSSLEVRSSALYCFVVGLVALTSFVLTAIAFSYLVPFIVGIPLLALLALFAVVTKAYGLIAVFHAVGTIVAGSRTRDQLSQRRWLKGDVAMVVIGVLILGAIRMIPVVGTMVWSFASIFGVGVALATKFGRREPWFLAWRPAEV